MIIRAAVPAEATELSAISMAAKAAWGYAAADLARWKPDLSITQESIAALPTFIAERNTEPAAFYQIQTNTTPFELEHFWVHPKHMRQGIGRAMFRHCAALLKASGQTLLAIDADPNAEPFYLARGAVKVGEVATPVQGHPHRVRPQLRLTL